MPKSYEDELQLLIDKVEGSDERSWEEMVDELGLSTHPDSLRKSFNGGRYSGYAVSKYFMEKFENEYSKYGYRIMSYEDTSYAMEVVPSYLFAQLKGYLTNDYAYYRSGWINEHDVPTYWHAKLAIKLSDVFRRIQWRDELLDKHPDFIRNDLVTREIEKLSFVVTKGLEFTPIYDEKGFIKKEYKDALQQYYRAHEKTTWGLYYTEFIHRLALNKYRNSDAIDRWVLKTIFPEDRKNIDPLMKYKDILIDNLME